MTLSGKAGALLLIAALTSGLIYKLSADGFFGQSAGYKLFVAAAGFGIAVAIIRKLKL